MATSHHWRRAAPWWRFVVILACTAAALWAVFHLTARSLERQAIWTDYALFRSAVNRWRDGLVMYGSAIPMFGAPRATEAVNFNPPQFHLLVWPFARLALFPGLLLWQACSILAGVVSAAVVVRTLRPGWSPMPAALAAAVILNSAALSSTLWFGQISLFLVVPVTLAWRAHRLARWQQVAIWMGIAGSIKPFLLIVFPYLLLKRQWRAVLWGGAAWAMSFALGVAVFGRAALEQWFVAAQWPTWVAHFHNASFQGYVGRVMIEWPGGLVASVGAAAGLATTIWLTYKRDADAAWALLMTGALLFAPLGWVYYEWIIAPPLAALIVARRIPRAAWLLVIAFVWPINLYTVHLTGTILDGAFASIYFWGLLGLWLVLCLSTAERDRTVARSGELPG